MQVSRAGAGPHLETFLLYSSSRFDSVLGVFINDFGFGKIPNEDFKAPGIKLTHHLLDTDTTNNFNIEATSSTFDPNTGQTTILPTKRGRINFEFVNNRQHSVSFNGTTVTRSAGSATTIRTHGIAETATAGFKGSFFGRAMEASSGGSTGTNHQMTMILEY